MSDVLMNFYLPRLFLLENEFYLLSLVQLLIIVNRVLVNMVNVSVMNMAINVTVTMDGLDNTVILVIVVCYLMS